MIPNDAQIEAEMQALINEQWPPAKREKAIRTGLLKAELDAFFVEITALKAQKVAARNFAQALHDYSTAKYQLPNEPALVEVVDENGSITEVPNPRIAELQAVLDAAPADVLAAYEDTQNA